MSLGSNVVALEEVNLISPPSDRALAARSESEVRLMSNGKSVRLASTLVWSMVIFFRYCQLVSYQPGSGSAWAIPVLVLVRTNASNKASVVSRNSLLTVFLLPIKRG